MKRQTQANKQLFLEKYIECKDITLTALTTGIARQTHYLWLDTDEDYYSQMVAIKKEVQDELLSRHEKNIDEIAFDKETPRQTRVLASMFKCKRYDPEYRDRPLIDRAIIGDIIIKAAVPAYSDTKQIENGV